MWTFNSWFFRQTPEPLRPRSTAGRKISTAKLDFREVKSQFTFFVPDFTIFLHFFQANRFLAFWFATRSILNAIPDCLMISKSLAWFKNADSYRVGSRLPQKPELASARSWTSWSGKSELRIQISKLNIVTVQVHHGGRYLESPFGRPRSGVRSWIAAPAWTLPTK